MNVQCPYCGSENMTVDCDIRITGILQPNGKIVVKDWWGLNELNNTVSISSSSDMQGRCADCGEYCSFSWESGFIKGSGIK
jgi:DNA-directed RNA polymerase subunit RPC12/RpoP